MRPSQLASKAANIVQGHFSVQKACLEGLSEVVRTNGYSTAPIAPLEQAALDNLAIANSYTPYRGPARSSEVINQAMKQTNAVHHLVANADAEIFPALDRLTQTPAAVPEINTAVSSAKDFLLQNSENTHRQLSSIVKALSDPSTGEAVELGKKSVNFAPEESFQRIEFERYPAEAYELTLR